MTGLSDKHLQDNLFRYGVVCVSVQCSDSCSLIDSLTTERKKESIW